MRTHRSPYLAACLTLGLLVALQASIVSADTILIDFNDNSTAGFGWNTFHSGNDNTTQPLIRDDGTPSGISIELPKFQDSQHVGWNPANPLPSWAPISVADDYSYFNWFVDGHTQTAQFVFTGLDPAALYTIDIIASRNFDRDQDFTLSHGGGVAFYDDWNTRTDGIWAGNVLTFEDLTSDTANEIAMEIRRESLSGAFNAFRLTSAAEPNTSVPEPNTFVLTSLGLALLVARRR